VFIVIITVKLLLDGIAYQLFIPAFIFFIKRKQLSLKKEALGLTPFNRVMICIIGFFILLQFVGTIFTFSNAVISLLDVYHNDSYTLYRVSMGDIVFPIRDFLEVLAFCYLFYFQSGKSKSHLAKVNETYYKQLNLTTNLESGLFAKERNDQGQLINKIQSHPESIDGGDSMRDHDWDQAADSPLQQTQFRRFLKG
jgi:hypothetical protein